MWSVCAGAIQSIRHDPAANKNSQMEKSKTRSKKKKNPPAAPTNCGKHLSCHGDECHKRGVNERYLVPLVRVPLVKVLPVLVFVHHDEVDLPHAVVEEEGVGLVVELGLGAEARLVRELHRLELVHLLLHDVVHNAGTQEGASPECRADLRSGIYPGWDAR